MTGSDPKTRTVASPLAARREALPSMRVTVLDGADRGKVTTVTGGRATIGRSVGADVVLTDPTVSQFHAELRVEENGIRVLDLGSRNGTYAGPVLLKEGHVSPGVELRLGATTLTADLDDATADELSASLSFGGLVGSSRLMRRTYALLDRLARTDLSVLIEGETGTGKEIAARALHDAGQRAKGPFIVIDCTSIPPTLAESVLFGHEKGAFTGATERKQGLFEAADGGTVFLDEVGELPMELQPKLLRVLERREVVSVGSSRARSINVRVASATWRDLRRRINEGLFREDLYHRLAQAKLTMPSLSDRPEDLRPLALHFLRKIPWETPAARAIAPEAMELIAARDFPGNVRELKNLVERTAMLADGNTIMPNDLAFERMMAAEREQPAKTLVHALDANAELQPLREAKKMLLDDFERAYLSRLLDRAGTNLSLAARLAGVDRHTLRDLLRKYGLRAED